MRPEGSSPYSGKPAIHPLTWTTRVEYISSNSISLRSILLTFSHLCIDLRLDISVEWSLPFRVFNHNFIRIFSCPPRSLFATLLRRWWQTTQKADINTLATVGTWYLTELKTVTLHLQFSVICLLQLEVIFQKTEMNSKFVHSGSELSIIYCCVTSGTLWKRMYMEVYVLQIHQTA